MILDAQDFRRMRGWCLICGAAPFQMCVHTEDHTPDPHDTEGATQPHKKGAPRSFTHFYRSPDQKERPAVLVPDEPSFDRGDDA